MAIFTAIAAAVVSAIGITGTAATIFTAIGATILSVGASRLLMKRQMRGASSGGSGGARIQLPPATENKLPVIYGSAYVGGSVTDAKISSDNKTMWYCVAIAEVTDTGGYTFDTSNIYYNGLKVQFGSQGVVTGLINNTTPATIDTKMSGQIRIYLFQNGATSAGQNTTQTAQQIMQDTKIPAGQRWTSTDTMTDCAFAIIKVDYNVEKGTTSLGGLTARITNSLTQPGDVINDYMQNTRYGCAIPAAQIDSTSLTALNTYSDYDLPYTDPTTGASTQKRYRINGPIATGNDCLTNLQILVDSCDSWLQYSEFEGKWRVIINQSYTDYTTIGSLYLVDDNNLVGGINVAPINLNETFNQLEVAYPNESVRDQTDYQLIKLEDYAVSVMSPNEALNKLDVDYPVVNTSVQSVYLGVRRLLQSREDVTITLQLDYSGIQVEAGDVILVKNNVYGWDLLNSGQGKLFRVANVAEEKYQDGSLGVRITAFEYNDTVYADHALTAYLPDPNTGLQNPNIMSTPIAPRVTIEDDGSIFYLQMVGTVPEQGLINVLDYNYGTDSDSQLHSFYTSTDRGNGDPMTAELIVTDLLIGQDYSIKTLGTTTWSTVGATVVDLSTQPTLSGFLIPGQRYIIETAGSTDFTLSGASSNAAGTIFTANNVVLASGSGVAIKTDFRCTSVGTGTGTVDTIFIATMSDLPANTYYWSIRAKNDTQGITGPAGTGVVWAGPNISTPKTVNTCNVNSTGTTLTFTPANDNLCLGGNVEITGGDGTLVANTYITQITSNVEFEVNFTPTVALANSCIEITCLNPITNTPAGGIDGDDIQDDSIPPSKITDGSTIGVLLDESSWAVVSSTAAGVPVLTPPVFGGINEPALITNTGSTISSTKIYPFYQGTSSTADGYIANSTGSLQPVYSELLNIVNGQDEWYAFCLTIIQNGFRPARDKILQQLQIQVVSDTDVTFQVVPYALFTGALTTFAINTQFMYNYELKANHPTGIDFTQDYFGFGGTGYAVGYCGRVIESTGTVTVVSGTTSAVVMR